MRVLVAALLALVLVPAAVAMTRPHVRLVATAPATISGSGFHPRERVVVTVSAGAGRLSKPVQTTAAGTFVAHFVRRLVVPQCAQYAVSAVGAHGERAAWKTAPQVCGTTLQP